ncbi:hypothetical protein K1719_020520 [Acacia pycnantha]|nr:hypothetical protein K1719_020520 [Acacia pycnantha]
MEPHPNKKASHSDQRKREKASKKKAEARKKEAFHGNANYGYYRPFNNGYGYGYGYGHGHPYPLHDGYYSYPYERPERYRNDEYVARAPLGYRDGFNHYGNLHFGDIDRPERYRYDEYVARAPLGYRDGFNHYGNLHFGDIDPYRCYQSFYETPVMSFPQAPPPRQTHPFYTPETVCSIM